MEIEILDILANIKKKYLNVSTSHKNQYPCHLGNMATLELVEIGGEARGQQIDGKNTVGKQVHLTYSNLFRRQHNAEKLERKVLVEGEAGIGKTILCTSIAEDWASGKLFQEFSIVLLLPLCQRNVASSQSLLELLKELYDFNQETCSCVASYLRNGESNILIITDGWDALCETEYQKGSFLHHLLFGDLFPSSSVTAVLTSRPDFVPLHTMQFIDQFVTVKGFDKETVKSCIHSEFSGNTEKLSYLTEQLENNPLVESMCSVPLNLAMVCNVCLQSCKEPLPNTMTELYTKLTWNLVHISIKKSDAYKGILTLSCYHDLPNELQQSWWILCELAFRNIEKCCAQLKATSLLSSELEMIETISYFGLLKSVSEVGDNVLFNFLHPTFEEYLAAVHLARQPPSTQFKFIELCAKMSHLNTTFWIFFLGTYVNEISHVSVDVIVHAIQMLSKLHLSSGDGYILCNYSLEAKNEATNREVVKVLSTIDSSGSASLHFGHSHNAHDCIAMMYVIENLEKQCSVEINFQNCNLKVKQVLKLASALGSRSNKVQVKGLDLSDNGLSDLVVVDFFDRAVAALLSLEKLILRNCGIGMKGVGAIMGALSSQSLRQLDLSFNPLSLSCLQTLQHHIDHGTLMKLEFLFLKGSLTKDISISCLASFADTLLSQCPRLRRLDLSENNLGKPGNPALSKVISQLTGLRRDFDLRLNVEYMSEVDDSFISVMEESIRRKGTIDHTIAHGVIVGPGRSGKNTLMSRLLGEKPDSKSPSTGVLENIVKVEVKKLCTVAASVNNLKWQRLEYDEEALELMMTTAKYYSGSNTVSKPMKFKYIVLEQPGSIVDVATEESSLAPSGDRDPSLSTSEAAKLVSEITKNTSYDSVGGDEEAIRDVIVYSSDVAPIDMFKKAVKLRRMDGIREHLESSWSLYLTNTGGQIEFQEHLPILVCGPSIFFVTFPLHYDLMEHYDVQYQYPDGRVRKYLSTATLMEELLQTLATISALDYTSSQHSSDIKPKVFFVGTHRDCLPESTAEEIIQKRDKQLQWYVNQTSLYQGSIQFAQSSEHRQLIFTVNNLSKYDDDFQKIRKAVQQAVERKHYKEFTVKCPSSWLIFSLILRTKHKSSQVLSFDECFNIAQECGISDRRELSKALSFIHSKLGLVRYFNVAELDTLVIVDPQILFDKITDLIFSSLSSDHAEMYEIEDCQKGIFSVAVMERISKKCGSNLQLPFTWLTKLLNYLRIAALFTDNDGDKYFFPSVICHVPEPHSKQAPPSDSPPPILVAFESGFCPRGIPGALIKCLMTNEMRPKWRWKLLPNRIFRNQVSFGIQSYGDVILKILPTHLEICIDSEADTTESELKVTCEEAYTQIKEGMKIVTSQYKVCDYFFGFYCTRDECKPHPHPAKIEWRGHNPSKLNCNVVHKRGSLRKGYEIWNIQKKRKKGIITYIVLRTCHTFTEMICFKVQCTWTKRLILTVVEFLDTLVR